MKVVLLGAPGADKTKIARRIVRRLNNDGKTWTVIDGYVDRLRNRTGWVFGTQSHLRNTIQILGERWTLEDEAFHKGLSSITCGGIYETMIYSAAQVIATSSLGDEDLLVAEYAIAQMTMQLLGALENHTFDYDAMFYLPLTEPADSWEGVVDAKILEVLEGFFRYAVTLEGTDRQKVDRATEIIQVIEQASVSHDEQAV